MLEPFRLFLLFPASYFQMSERKRQPKLLLILFFANWREEADKLDSQLSKQTSNTTLEIFKTSSVFEQFLYIFIHRNSAVKDTST